MKSGAIFRNGHCLVPDAWRADTWWSRLRGLLARPPLAATEGLLLSPCASVHTLGMGYPLDIVFLDRAGQVLAWRATVAPWRACGHRGAHQTLELAAGSLEALRPSRGEVWEWRPESMH